MKKVFVTSLVAKKNRMIMMSGITFFAVLLILDMIKFFTLHSFEPMSVAVNVLFLITLFNRVQAKYTCELKKSALVFTKLGLWGNKQYEIDFHSVMGIYRYQPKFVEVMRFRHTARLHSALDNRDVWTIAYTVHTKKGKIENCRIYFKPDSIFLAELRAAFHEKVMPCNDKVVLADLNRSV